MDTLGNRCVAKHILQIVQWLIREKYPCGRLLIGACPSGIHAEGTSHEWSSVVVINWSPWPASASELLNSQCIDALKPSERERELALHLQGWWRIMGRENSLFWSEKYFFGKQRTGGARLTPGIRYKTVPCSTFWFSCSFFRGKALFPAYFINHPGHREDLPFMSDLWWSKAEVLPECHKIRDASRGKEADLFGDIMCPYMKCFSSYCSWTDRDSAKTRIRKLSN